MRDAQPPHGSVGEQRLPRNTYLLHRCCQAACLWHTSDTCAETPTLNPTMGELHGRNPQN